MAQLSEHQKYIMDVIRDGGAIWEIAQAAPPSYFVLAGNIHNRHICLSIREKTVNSMVARGLIEKRPIHNDGIHCAMYIGKQKPHAR